MHVFRRSMRSFMRTTYKYSLSVARKLQTNPNQLLLDWNATSATGTPSPTVAAPEVKTGTPLPAPPKRSLHESLELFLRERGVPYINVDEAKRALFAGAKLRSFHFV